jgi:hypothetical protein
MGGGAMPNDMVSFSVSFHQKGLTPWMLHTSPVGIVEAITSFATVALQMASKNSFATRVANRVVQILAATRILLHEEMRSSAPMKSAVVCAVLNAPLASLVTPSARG